MPPCPMGNLVRAVRRRRNANPERTCLLIVMRIDPYPRDVGPSPPTPHLALPATHLPIGHSPSKARKLEEYRLSDSQHRQPTESVVRGRLNHSWRSEFECCAHTKPIHHLYRTHPLAGANNRSVILPKKHELH